MQPGSIVWYGPREGDDRYIAIVQHTWPDESVQLFVLHHQASANVRAARKEECELIFGPDHLKSLQVAITALNDKMNYLMERLPESEDEEKPWPSSSSASTSRARRQPSNASATS